MWHITTNSTQYILQPSVEETGAVIEALKRLEKSLLEVPEPQPQCSRFYLGVLPDEIIWMGDNTDSYTGPRPSMGALLDIEEFGQDRISSLTPAGLHALMFRGANRKATSEALALALYWERDRVARGEDPDVNLPCIQENLSKVVEIVWESCRTVRRSRAGS